MCYKARNEQLHPWKHDMTRAAGLSISFGTMLVTPVQFHDHKGDGRVGDPSNCEENEQPDDARGIWKI